MNINQQREAFEAWASKQGRYGSADCLVDYRLGVTRDAEKVWQAALQSQDAEDAGRLDWLEEQAQTSRTGVSIDYVYDAQDGYVNEKGYRFMRHRFIGPLGKTAREAIDHACRVEGDRE